MWKDHLPNIVISSPPLPSSHLASTWSSLWTVIWNLSKCELLYLLVICSVEFCVNCFYYSRGGVMEGNINKKLPSLGFLSLMLLLKLFLKNKTKHLTNMFLLNTLFINPTCFSFLKMIFLCQVMRDWLQLTCLDSLYFEQKSTGPF